MTDAVTDPKAEAKAAKAAAKQAKKDAKAQAKLDAAAAKQAKKDAKASAKASPKDDRKAAKAAAKQAKKDEKQAALDAKLARYKQLRANVRRRRGLYILFILLALGVFAGSVWDILYNESDYKWFVYGAYAFLFVWGLLLLLSRRRHLEDVEEMLNLERVFLEDPVTHDVFQLAASKMPNLVGVEFSSPVSGQFYKMPNLESQQVERVLPPGALQRRPFKFQGVEGEVATFGKEPGEVSFRKTNG